MTTTKLIAACWTTAGDAVPLDGRDDSPVPMAVRIRAASNAGFSGFGIVHNDLRRYLLHSDLKTLRTELDDAAIELVQLEFLTDWWLPDSERTASDETLELLVTASETLRADHVKVGPDISSQVYDIDQYAAHFHRVSEAFSEVGTKVALEFMPFSNISTLGQALELVQTANHPNGGLMIDLWHMMRGSGTLEELAAVPLEFIKAVELDDGDAQQVGSGYEDTVLRRKLCGEGDFPVVEFIDVMRAVGWCGPWGLEILSDTYRRRPLADALNDAYVTTMACFADEGQQIS